METKEIYDQYMGGRGDGKKKREEGGGIILRKSMSNANDRGGVPVLGVGCCFLYILFN